MNTVEKVAESNRIEGIGETRLCEIDAHERIMVLARVTTEDLQRFVVACQPDAKLRSKPGMNVRVGNHVPPLGGPEVLLRLEDLLVRANTPDADPWKIHLEYENLHPFTDGNGRSGRVLWYWMMRDERMADLGFLHAFYYQTLARTTP